MHSFIKKCFNIILQYMKDIQHFCLSVCLSLEASKRQGEETSKRFPKPPVM